MDTIIDIFLQWFSYSSGIAAFERLINFYKRKIKNKLIRYIVSGVTLAVCVISSLAIALGIVFLVAYLIFSFIKLFI